MADNVLGIVIVIDRVTVGAIIVLVGEMKVAGQSALGLKENEMA